MNKYFITLCFINAMACAPDIGGDKGSGGDTGSGIDSVTDEAGTVTTVIDATSEEEWVYLDFESGELVAITASPETNSEWDLGLQRWLLVSPRGLRRFS